MPIQILALEDTSDYSEYVEHRDQIDFDDLTICIVNDKDVVVEVDQTANLLKTLKAKKQKEKYDKYIDGHPESIGQIQENIKDGNYICAISYTEAPLIDKGDHYERVKKEEKKKSSLFAINAYAADISKKSDASKSYNLTLQTTILRRGTSYPYQYTAITSGEWTTSIKSGKTAPAAGGDFVLQSCPTVTNKSAFSSVYNYKTNGSINGQEGTNYFQRNGGNSWVEYEVIDDPVGIAQLKSFRCSQTFKARTTSYYKKINSYYVHTWKQMTLSVTPSTQAGFSGENPVVEVGLSLTPSIKSEQWQLHNAVSFNW